MTLFDLFAELDFVNYRRGIYFYMQFSILSGQGTLDNMQKDLYRQGMTVFGGIAPTYHIELLEKPVIV